MPQKYWVFPIETGFGMSKTNGTWFTSKVTNGVGREVVRNLLLFSII